MKRLEDAVKKIITPQEDTLFNKSRILAGKIIKTKNINNEEYHVVRVDDVQILAKEIFPISYIDRATKIGREVFIGRIDTSDDWVILGYKKNTLSPNTIKIKNNLQINKNFIQLNTKNTILTINPEGLFLNNKKVCVEPCIERKPIEIPIEFGNPETFLYLLSIYESNGCYLGYDLRDINTRETIHLPDPNLEYQLVTRYKNGFPVYNKIIGDSFSSRNANCYGGLLIFFKIPLPPSTKIKMFISQRRYGTAWGDPIIKVIDSRYRLMEFYHPPNDSSSEEEIELLFSDLTNKNIIGVIIGDGQATYECKDIGDHEVIVKNIKIILQDPLILYKQVYDRLRAIEKIPRFIFPRILDYTFSSDTFKTNSRYIIDRIIKQETIKLNEENKLSDLLTSGELLFSQKFFIDDFVRFNENETIYKGLSKTTLDELSRTIENLWQKNKNLFDYVDSLEKISFQKELTDINLYNEKELKTIKIKDLLFLTDTFISSKDNYKPVFLENIIPQEVIISSKDNYTPLFEEPTLLVEKIFIHNKWIYETTLLSDIVDGTLITKDRGDLSVRILKNSKFTEQISNLENIISSKDNYSPIFIEQIKTIETFEYIKWQYHFIIQYEKTLSELLKLRKYSMITSELTSIDIFSATFYSKDIYYFAEEFFLKMSLILPEITEASEKFFYEFIANDNLKGTEIVNSPDKIQILSIVFWNENIALIRIIQEIINNFENINVQIPQVFIQENITQIEEISKSGVKLFDIEHVKTITEHITYPIHTIEFEKDQYLLYIETADYPGPAHVYDLTTNQRYDVPTPNNRGRGGCIVGDYVYIGGGGYNSQVYKYNYKTQVNKEISGSIGYDAVIKPILYPLFFISWVYQSLNYKYFDNTETLNSITNTSMRYSTALKLRHSINNDKFFLFLNGGGKISVVSYSYSTFTPTIEYNEYNTIDYSHGDASNYYPLFALPDPNQNKIKIYNYMDTSEISIPIADTPLICVFPKKAKDFLFVITKNPAKIILLKKQGSTYTQVYTLPLDGTPTSAEISMNDQYLAVGTTNSVEIFHLNFGIINEAINSSEYIINNFIKRTYENINSSEYNKISYIIKDYEKLLDLLNSTPLLKISSVFIDTEIINREIVENFSSLENYKFPSSAFISEKSKSNEFLGFFISLSLIYNITEKITLGSKIIEEILNFEETNIKKPEEYVHIETKVFTTPTNYTVFENLNSDLHDEYIFDFEVLFPDSHSRDYGIYFVPGNSDDDQWIYAHIFGYNSGYGISINDIISRPVMTGVGWAYPSYSRGTTRIVNKYYSNLYFSTEYNTILLDNRYKVTCTNTGISKINRFPYDKLQIKCTEKSFLGRISLYQRTKPFIPPKLTEKINSIEGTHFLDKETTELFYKVINQGNISYSNVEIPFYIQTDTPDKVVFYLNNSKISSSFYKIKNSIYMYVIRLDIPSFSNHYISIKYEEQDQPPIFTYSFHESFNSNSLTPDRWMPLEYPSKTIINENKLYFTGDTTTNYLTFKYIPPSPFEYTVRFFIENITRNKYDFGMTNRLGKGVWIRGSTSSIEVNSNVSNATSMTPTFPSHFDIHFNTYYMIGEFSTTSCSIYNTLRLSDIFINSQGDTTATTVIISGIQLVQKLPPQVKVIPLNNIGIEFLS